MYSIELLARGREPELDHHSFSAGTSRRFEQAQRLR